MVAPNCLPADVERLRLDKWLWAARFFKTRSAAAHAVEGGRVKVADERVKPARALHPGDRLSIRIGAFEWIVTVRALSDRRGPASVARALYDEDEQSRERRDAAIARVRAGFDPEPAHGGRPEKRERRELRRVRGY
ncbi:MAG: RNA-binding S4 domain-containing protein [Burkholderiales bacterium]|nr:RNA-binding S4 domain-containing protein [Burkholderiales bacterium]